MYSKAEPKSKIFLEIVFTSNLKRSNYILALIIFILLHMIQVYTIFFKRVSIIFNIHIKQINDNQLHCLENGWPSNGSKLLWNFFYYPEYPSLQDIFEDNGNLLVILSAVLVQTHSYQLERMKMYHSSRWALYFHFQNGKIVNPNDPIITKSDYNHQTLIIKLRFQIPVNYQYQFNYATIQIILNDNDVKPSYRPLNENEPLYSPEYIEEKVEELNRTKISMKPPNFTDNIDDISYRKVPFCAIKDRFSFYVNPPQKRRKKQTKKDQLFFSQNGQKKDFLRICTENFIFDEKKKNEEIFRWILYHIEQGFSKPILYVNKIDFSEEKSFSHFEKINELGLVEMIYFVFPFSFLLHDQPAQEASCIERNRGRTVWLAHNDVDERFFHINSDSNFTVSEILNKYTNVLNFEKFSGLKCPNVWMKKFSNDSTFADVRQLDHFYRTKGIIFPENVGYYYIHSVSDGKIMMDVDDIVNAHFKNMFDEYVYCPKLTEINQRISKKIKKLLV